MRLHTYQGKDLETIKHSIRHDFINGGFDTDRGEWQAMRDDRPQTQVFELPNVTLQITVPDHTNTWASLSRPNLPWAEDHFQERISGIPSNPGLEYKNWPWYKQGVEEHKPEGKFSHTYMERIWPKLAGFPDYPPTHHGIRFEYGDLNDLLQLLTERPHTRQAYLPIWFPEDLTAAKEGERVPCSLGYHFINYGEVTDCTYYMRSCDWYRYFNDDVYMAGRLLQYVAWNTNRKPRNLQVHIANLHIFSAEKERLVREHHEENQRRLSSLY